MIYQRPKLSGFTIVELLIVIVVIAILAAITIVSYNGITKQAQNAAIASTTDTYSKILGLYKVETNSLPPGGSWQHDTTCLGNLSDYPAKDGFQEGECVFDDNYNGGQRRAHAVHSETTDALESAAVTSNIPPASIPLVRDGSTRYRGMTYHPKTPGHYDGSWNWIEGEPYYHIHYYIQGTQACPSGTAFAQGQLTECVVSTGPPDDDLEDGVGHGGEW